MFAAYFKPIINKHKSIGLSSRMTFFAGKKRFARGLSFIGVKTIYKTVKITSSRSSLS